MSHTESTNTVLHSDPADTCKRAAGRLVAVHAILQELESRLGKDLRIVRALNEQLQKLTLDLAAAAQKQEDPQSPTVQ